MNSTFTMRVFYEQRYMIFLLGLFLYEILYLKEYLRVFVFSKYSYLQSPVMSL